MTKKPLCLALLWHMHQPDYGDVQAGEVYLPWTRFHAVKDYYDMAALAAETPGLRLTFNMVPSLMDQLDAYGAGRVRETCAELTLRNASELDEREKLLLLRTFFQLPWERLVSPFPRYRELLDKRGYPDSRGQYPEGLKRFTTRDYRDLQTWFNLVWCGPALRRNPIVSALFAKGKGFTEEEKRCLLAEQTSFIARILPYYRSLLENSRIEVAVSPYYHPILPLLCDSRSAREAQPGVTLPKQPFSSPEDAREQIRRALSRYRECFGREAHGMWPSEGSLSNAELELASEAGIRWLASDEAVLANSLRAGGRDPSRLAAAWKYEAYRWGEGETGPCLFFRDHGLSDLIGFTYSRWKAEAAVGDFLRKLRAIHDGLPDDGRHYVVPVILDGENAWEHYPDNGTQFLRGLYRHIVDSQFIRPVTFAEYLELERHREPLPSVVAGSWIYGTLSTWIGHPEKNRGWDALSAARAFLVLREDAAPPAAREAAWREMMIAEGSDWFWWFGDEHPTQNAAEFDALFRSHVKNVYRLLGERYPADLDIPIKKAEVRTQYRNPVDTIGPVIDGRVTDYFEWLSAGYAVPVAGESMHRSRRYLEKIYFGYDAERFYVRIDLFAQGAKGLPLDASVQLQFVAPSACLVTLERAADKSWRCRASGLSPTAPPPEYAADKIIEIGVSLAALGLAAPGEVRFGVTILQEGYELERFPPLGFLAVAVDQERLGQQEWMV